MTTTSESQDKLAADPTPVVGEEAIVSDVLQETKLEPQTEKPAAPDGGLYGWLKVLGSFLVFMNIWGVTFSFGAFQSYYETDLLSTSSPSAISWIGTVQSFLLVLVGVVSGPLFDLGYYRSMVFGGSLLEVFGIMMQSLSKSYYQIFLTQGVCVGLGAGFLYIPGLALVGSSFTKNRAAAMGVVTAGIAVGGVIYVISFSRLLPRIGYAWAVRVMGFICLSSFLLAFPNLLAGPSYFDPSRPRKARRLLDMSAFHEAPWVLFTTANFFIFMGYITPFFYIPTFATGVLGSSQSMSMYFLVISVSGSFFGRLIISVTAQWTGVMLPWVLCGTISGMMCFVWIAVDTVRGFIAFCIVYGFFSAALVTMPSAAMPLIIPDLSLLGTRLGMSWGISSFAVLIGSPIAGAIVSSTQSGGGGLNFLGVQAWSGACVMLGSLLLVALWIMTVKRLKTKVLF